MRLFRRRRRSAGVYLYAGRWIRLRKWLVESVPLMVFGLQFAVTMAIVLHLAMALVAPAGHFPISESRVPTPFAYLTWLPGGNAIGFPQDATRHRFLFFKIFGQDGAVVEGSLPDHGAYHLIRYDRWSRVGEVVSRDNPTLHRNMLLFLLERLPSPPLKVELYAGVWAPGDVALPVLQASKRERERSIAVHLLGTYDGLHRTWTPARERKGI